MRYLFLGLVFVAGCGVSPEKAVLRESLNQAIAPALDENIDLVERIATGKPLPKFVPADVEIRKLHKQSVQKLIEEDRANDAKGFFVK